MIDYWSCNKYIWKYKKKHTSVYKFKCIYNNIKFFFKFCLVLYKANPNTDEYTVERKHLLYLLYCVLIDIYIHYLNTLNQLYENKKFL